MKRRSFLRHLAHSVAVPGMVGTMGFRMPGANSLNSLLRLAGETDRVLVLIFLEGGNDGLNTVIPLAQLSNLNRARPHVMLPENSLIPVPNTELAFHPAMVNMLELYKENRFQIVQNVGYPEQNYSHFRSTDIWMSASDSDTLVNSGWGGRYLSDIYPGYPEAFPTATMPDPLAVEIGYGGSLLFQGPQAAMSMVISDPSFFYQLVENEEEDAPATRAGDKLRFVRLIERQSQQYGEIVKNAAEKASNSVAYPATFLGEQLKIVSRLIAGGLQTPVYMVRLGGFDTHDAQVEATDHTTGEHADLLTELDEAIMAFMKDTDALGTSDRILGMTFSEFGRRIVSNASLGTDHGSSAPLFFFGNKLRGGVLGTDPVIPGNAIYDTNLDWEFDFRQLYASVLEQWFDASSVEQENSLLKTFETLPIIGEPVEILNNHLGLDRGLNVYPNPLSGSTTIQLDDISEPLVIEVVNLAGKIVDRPFSGRLTTHTIQWSSAGLIPGKYFVRVRSESGIRTFPVLKGPN